MTFTPRNLLLRRYLDGTCTEAEKQRVEQWLQQNPDHAEALERFTKRYTRTVSINEQNVKNKLLQRIEDVVPRKGLGSVRPKRSYFSRWAAATVVILLMLSASIGAYLWEDQPGKIKKPVYVERTMPAGKTATLTLSDGSIIYLNSGSTVRFPRQFGPDVRKVFLKGEAFFEVTPDESKPFKVVAGNIETTVLGTAFNVKAFPGERRVQVAVEHGQVAVKSTGTASSPVLLAPSQWVTYDKERHKLKKESGNIRRLIAWKEGILYFNNKTVAEVSEILERWYGVEILIKNDALKDCVLHGEYKEESLENVLKAMQFALSMDYQFVDDDVIITGGRCR